MKRTIIKIDEEKCNGCGLCAQACHEGAIAIENGKAKLVREDYCDGLGDCLPACPTGAITKEVREAAAYDESAVAEHKAKKAGEKKPPCGCPSANIQVFDRKERAEEAAPVKAAGAAPSELRQFPVQLKLVPSNAPYFNGAKLLVAADCTAFAYGNFHADFIKGKITLIGCPKLDEGDYAEKLTEILSLNDIRSLTVVRMEVPCCGGIAEAAKRALKMCGKLIPWSVVTISRDGKIID